MATLAGFAQPPQRSDNSGGRVSLGARRIFFFPHFPSPFFLARVCIARLAHVNRWRSRGKERRPPRKRNERLSRERERVRAKERSPAGISRPSEGWMRRKRVPFSYTFFRCIRGSSSSYTGLSALRELARASEARGGVPWEKFVVRAIINHARSFGLTRRRAVWCAAPRVAPPFRRSSFLLLLPLLGERPREPRERGEKGMGMVAGAEKRAPALSTFLAGKRKAACLRGLARLSLSPPGTGAISFFLPPTAAAATRGAIIRELPLRMHTRGRNNRFFWPFSE